MRGNPCRFRRSSSKYGSIPACAKEPTWRSSIGTFARVYPRVCGGNHLRINNRRCNDGSIPACAGEPSRIPIVCPRSGVYPRVCGGTELSKSLDGVRQMGLSPRVRGNLNYARQTLAAGFHGSIPACAGEPSSLQPDSTLSRYRVYPRVCGGTEVTSKDSGTSPRDRGLSPRVRGNLQCPFPKL